MNTDDVLEEIMLKIYDDVFGKYDTSHLGTFAEIKSIPNIDNIYVDLHLINAVSPIELEKAIKRLWEIENEN